MVQAIDPNPTLAHEERSLSEAETSALVEARPTMSVAEVLMTLSWGLAVVILLGLLMSVGLPATWRVFATLFGVNG